MPKGIPKYVQVLNIVDIKDNNLKDHLIKSYELDGVLVDNEMLRRNPNAKQEIIFITSTSKNKVMIEGSSQFEGNKEEIGNWIYCGNLFYVRKINDKHQFAQYLAYNTESRETEGLWDSEVYQ